MESRNAIEAKDLVKALKNYESCYEFLDELEDDLDDCTICHHRLEDLMLVGDFFDIPLYGDEAETSRDFEFYYQKHFKNIQHSPTGLQKFLTVLDAVIWDLKSFSSKIESKSNEEVLLSPELKIHQQILKLVSYSQLPLFFAPFFKAHLLAKYKLFISDWQECLDYLRTGSIQKSDPIWCRLVLKIWNTLHPSQSKEFEDFF